ncbi:MAG: DUF1573 domain-containing protein [Acidobacteriota bacterium]|nr:DUF1573 domain-containing protein [Acidobacteriota bacterium]
MNRLPIRAVLTLAAGILTALSLPALAANAAADETAAEEATGPKAVAVEEVLDLGTIPKGETLKVEWELRNEGTEPLEITQVRPSCGCTVATYDEVIAPGATGKVRAEIDTTNLFGADTKRVTVLTNDPNNPSIVLTAKSEVKPYLNAIPGYARFNVVQDQQKGSVDQSIWAQDGSDFNIVSATATEDYLTVAVREATEEERAEDAKGKQYQVSVTLAKDAPIGPITSALQITTDHPKQKTMSIPISGFVRPVLAVTPQTANFRKIELKEPLQANILVKNYAVEKIDLTSIQSTIPTISAEIIPLEEGRRFQIRLLVSPDTPKGDFNGMLKIQTDSPKVPSLEVPVIGTVI